MGISILTIMVLLVFDLVRPDSLLERVLMPSASPTTPVERVLDRLPERLPSRIR